MTKYTIKDIARETGYSISTVSRVLNNKSEGMTNETRQKILQTVAKLNYQPNQFARGLITKKSNVLGLMVPNILNPYFAQICRGAEDEAARQGYSLIICNSDDNPEKEKRYIRLLKERQVDGMLLASMNRLSAENEFYLTDSQIPFVLVDRGNDQNIAPGVSIDNLQGGYLAGNHLLELGHRNIACMTGPSGISNSEKRLQGFLMAMKEKGVQIPFHHIIDGNYDMDSAYSEAKRFLQTSDVTAIFTHNDLMACGVYEAANELGIAIPDQLSVIGFDDIPFCNVLSPKLTTIRQDTYKMGQESVNLLVKQIEKEPTESLFCEPTLVIRSSTANI
ncbi:LacI family DNA-binding transcriptional regulator [Virgibacillus sp. C22-A2]|uniref:LacI family DNA-binding transcriptional regulator n=1 Tax=Virgibacillus tibetensis TaxID=3042313 RepID=A0ABU6KDC6_9BACI|nr:LacI family DNA-binding transcriptional regulator [Virgibacillus sp. C22-A2]